MTTAIKRAVTDLLKDLREDYFEKFKFQLRDRREEPLFPRNDVDNKSVEDVVDVLFIKFTASEALQVSLDILRQINCNAPAERLGEYGLLAGYSMMSFC